MAYKLKNDEMYVITAYRHKDRASHSYIVALSHNELRAKDIADNHCRYRGGKYMCIVEECIPDEFDNNAVRYTTEVYRVLGSHHH